MDCKKKLAALKAECCLLTQKGLTRGCYELQKHALALLEKILDGNSNKEAIALQEDLAYLKKQIADFEKEADDNRLIHAQPSLPSQEFESQERERRDLFFRSSVHALHPALYTSKLVRSAFFRVVPLDGQTCRETEEEYSLYTDQFYRFLIQTPAVETKNSTLIVKVLEKGHVIHVENIDLPFKSSEGWQRYLKDGMIFIPDTHLKLKFSFELRLRLTTNAQNQSMLIVYQKSTDVRYQIAISLDQEPLYVSTFSAPPPWQLETLKKPTRIQPHKVVIASQVPHIEEALKIMGQHTYNLEACPVLDQFIENHQKNPLALASFVHNEIALVDPFVYQEEGVFYPLGIQKTPSRTFLEKQGSA